MTKTKEKIYVDKYKIRKQNIKLHQMTKKKIKEDVVVLVLPMIFVADFVVLSISLIVIVDENQTHIHFQKVSTVVMVVEYQVKIHFVAFLEFHYQF